MPLILSGNVATATASTTYDVANSCRFNDGDSPHMEKDQGTPTSQNKFTYSGWIKKCTNAAGDEQHIFSLGDGGDSVYNGFRFKTDDTLELKMDSTDTGSGIITTNRVFRDPAAFYHIVVAVDTTQGVAANRVKLYVNGVQETSFSAANYPTEDRDYAFLASGQEVHIGNQTSSGNSEYFDGYMAEVVFIDGLQLAATSFGEFDDDSPTIWKPIDVSGLTFGTNGFYLDFEASDNLGNDANGGTDLSETNIAAADQSSDTPTNNFPTINPLFKNDCVYSEGNLDCTIAGSDFDSGISTFGASTGKWYMEYKITSLSGSSNTRNSAGIVASHEADTIAEGETGYTANSIGWQGISTGSVHKDSSNVGGSFGSYTTNDILGIAMDLDNGKWYCAKNNAWENSGDPTSGATGTGAIAIDITSGYTYLFSNTVYHTSAFSCNFGSPSYANTSDAADANGYGKFEYAPPSGYFALCTKNLAEYG